MRELRLFAHRGASAEAPENTMSAFRRALAISGVNALELDVHGTRDGHVIVSHDPTARRMAGIDVAWHDITLAEAQKLNMGEDTCVPTLEEILTALPPVTLSIDIKQLWPPITKRVIQIIRTHHAEDRVVLASFHWANLIALRLYGYRGQIALSSFEVIAIAILPRAMLKLLPLGNCAQIPERAGPFLFANAKFIKKCHDLGIRVDFWTINDPQRAIELLDLGADGIMTDDPKLIAPVFADRRDI